MEYIKINQFGLIPLERTFTCRYCGLTVEVRDRKDKRFVYCSSKCEKQYWRKESKKSNSNFSRGREKTTMRTYSAGNYIKKLYYEKKESIEVNNMIGNIQDK